jgi:hypothetical protein
VTVTRHDLQTMADVLSLGGVGNFLRISLRPQRNPEWFTGSIEVSAFPFHGILQTTFTTDDLARWATALRDTTLPRTVTLGGDRAAELTLKVEEQQGGEDGMLAVEVELTPSGDDPYPFLRFLLFDVDPGFGAGTADALGQLAS